MEERSLVTQIGEKEVEKNMMMTRFHEVLRQKQVIVQRNIPEEVGADIVHVNTRGEIFAGDFPQTESPDQPE